MSNKQELIDYITNLTPAQMEKLWQNREALEKKLSVILGKPISLASTKEV